MKVVEFATGAPQLLKGEFTENAGTRIDSHSLRQSQGGIIPFNFPAMVPMRMFPVVLACGNIFILKPTERDTFAFLLIAEWLKEAGLPDGVFNSVHVDKEAVEAILTDPDIVAVSFVRSTPIARCILAEGAELVVNGREFRRQAMRMGGQEKNRSALRRDRKLIGRGVAHQRLAYL